jgi:hypothetical protein|tara:strand:+ start:963 stop:1190 length:228 start_codon:yes stop_codon:yes gene_type:complete
MKEQKLVELVNKVNGLENIVKQLITELYNLKDLSVGTLEAVKLMPGYDDAIIELTKQLEEANKKQQEKKLDLNVE